MNEAVRELYGMVYTAVKDGAQAKEICRLLCREIGGVEVYLPQSMQEEREECRILDACFSEVLGELYGPALERFFRLGGLKIYVPKELSAFRREVAFEVMRALEGGEARVFHVAKFYKISASTVYNLRNQALKWRMEEQAKRQPSLF